MTYPFFPHVTDKKPDPAHTIKAVTSYYMVMLARYFHSDDVVKAVHTRTRKVEVAIIRHCFRWLLCRHFSASEVGRYFGFDHTTVLHSLNYVDHNLPIQKPKLHKQISNIPKP